ncbi:NAD(P)-dependent alcohol dehydrogenase [Bacillus sp. DJP31]|uniref:NAD(P)-dependent alcohol dehydrogenase n=1 Tax=Bacillus sp. DJP31 TaxID=3409789 RepID=UPI003BB7E01C
MKAIVYTEYGSSDVLQLTEVGKPTPKDNEVLVKVYAASVNPLDWHFMRGTPYLVRLNAGLRRPKSHVLGVDVAGKVEAVGKDVKEFQPGDDVFGACNGAFAEYVCASERSLVKKPAKVSFEQAAAVPIASFTAVQGLRNQGQIQPGQKVLINGAAGGVGTFAVQIAKSFGAEVTGVCSTRNVDMVRSIGADHVIDYTQEDFTQSGQRYDQIFDTVGNRSLSDCRRALGQSGTLVLVGGPDKGRLLGPMNRSLRGLVMSRFVSQRMVMLMAAWSKDDLVLMQELLSNGKVTPVIDRRYTLSEVPEAIRYLEEGHAQGKVVITLEHNNED